MFDISVIIVSFNTKKLTLACIKSVFSGSNSVKKEVIIVDNHSTDGSTEDIKSLAKNNSAIKLIENDHNLGFAKANNQAIRKASGKYILLLNSDAEVKKNSLKNIYDFAEIHPDAGAVVPRLLNSDGSNQASVFKLPTIRRAIKQYWLGKKGLLDKYCPDAKTPLSVESAVMAAFLITPKALEKVGLLNEEYFMYFEDLDYCRSLGGACLKIYYLPGTKVYHHHGASGKNLADEKDQWRRLVPSSKLYHGLLKHYLINFIIWTSQKWQGLSH